MINKDKFSAMFSKGTSAATKSVVLVGLGIQAESHNQQYLGLPIHIGASRS